MAIIFNLLRSFKFNLTSNLAKNKPTSHQGSNLLPKLIDIQKCWLTQKAILTLEKRKLISLQLFQTRTFFVALRNGFRKTSQSYGNRINN